MLKPLLLASLAAAAMIPSLASAQDQCQSNGGNRVVGTVLGAGVGALLGNAIGEHGGKTGGTIIGGVGGAVVGNQIAGAGSRNCQSNRYGYYDSNGRWVPNTANSNGYYDVNGQWVTNSQNNYDPRYGQSYASQPDYTPQSGYGSQPGYAPPPPPYAQDYRDREDPNNRQDLMTREAWLDQDIRQRMANDSLDHQDAHRALRELRDIRRVDANSRDDDNRLNPDQQAELEHRLNDLANRVSGERRYGEDRQPGY